VTNNIILSKLFCFACIRKSYALRREYYLREKNVEKTCMPLRISTVLFIALMLLLQSNSAVSHAATPETPFSVIWITDTQYLSESHPTYYDNLCRWIVYYAETYNVKMVIHTGDMVEDEWNRTQWASANKAMSRLLENSIPYCWNAGNHDYNATYWIGNEYTAFNPEVMTEKPYWLGDAADGQSTAVHFSISGWDLLIINIAYQADDVTLAWANNLLDAYPESHAIVATHVYLNGTGGYSVQGKENPEWPISFRDTFLDKHANVFMTLSGHYNPTSGSRNKVGDRHELMFNRQDRNGKMGAASLRILTFDIANETVEVKTYVLYADQFLTDSNNNFTLDTNFFNSAAHEIHSPTPSPSPQPTESPSPTPPLEERPLFLYAIVVCAFFAAIGAAAFLLRKRR